MRWRYAIQVVGSWEFGRGLGSLAPWVPAGWSQELGQEGETGDASLAGPSAWSLDSRKRAPCLGPDSPAKALALDRQSPAPGHAEKN